MTHPYCLYLRFFSSPLFFVAHSYPLGTSCLPLATGDLLIGYGYIGYDNIGMAIFSLIIVMSTEQWAQLMYWVR
jgi:hypothetical protein